MPDCSKYAVPWGELTTDDLYAFLKLRTDVFFLEQTINETELDDRDQEPDTRHYWIADDRGAAAYLRTLVDAEPEHLDAHRIVGRVVVRADRRGEGLAQVLLGEVIERDGGKAMLMHAQDYIAPLYVKFGFVSFGEKFVEAGITHVSMYRAGTA